MPLEKLVSIITIMQKIVFTLVFITLPFATNLWAQTQSTPIDRTSSYLLNNPVSQSNSNVATWQLTLDVIKSKAQDLLQKNSVLMAERESLLKAYDDEQEAIRNLKKNNEESKQFLKQRHGRSDEQFKIDELEAQVKQKKESLKEAKDILNSLKAQAQGIDQKIQLKKLQLSDLQIQRNQEDLKVSMQETLKVKDAAKDDDELKALKEKLKQSNDQEEALEKQLQSSKEEQAFRSNIPAGVSHEQINDLQIKLDNLKQQKEDLQKRLNNDNTQAHMKRYQDLMTHKEELEERIKGFETILNQLRYVSKEKIVEDRADKQMLKQMSALDNQNAQLRQKVQTFQENVKLLKLQVKRLERRADNQKNAPNIK